jgi:hypothetical protein
MTSNSALDSWSSQQCQHLASTGSSASDCTTPNRLEMVEIFLHPSSMNMEDGLVLSSHGELSFSPIKNEQSFLAKMHNWNIMAPFTATRIPNLHCFSSLNGPL